MPQPRQYADVAARMRAILNSGKEKQLMSHKIHKNKAAKQQAYRDRLEAARKAAAKAFWAAGSNIHLPLGQAHIRGEHKQTPDPTCPACNTVTPIQTPVTVGASA